MSDRVVIPLKSTKQLMDGLKRFQKSFPEEIAKATARCVAYDIIKPSVRECPVKTGVLRASVFIDDPVVRDGNLSIGFGYTRYYSVYVHENLDSYHKPPTKAKFLEDPMMRAVPNIANSIMKETLRIVEREVSG